MSEFGQCLSLNSFLPVGGGETRTMSEFGQCPYSDNVQVEKNFTSRGGG